MLDFKDQWWRHAGAKEAAIREQFGLGATRYYQRLNALIDTVGHWKQDACWCDVCSGFAARAHGIGGPSPPLCEPLAQVTSPKEALPLGGLNDVARASDGGRPLRPGSL